MLRKSSKPVLVPPEQWKVFNLLVDLHFYALHLNPDVTEQFLSWRLIPGTPDSPLSHPLDSWLVWTNTVEGQLFRQCLSVQELDCHQDGSGELSHSLQPPCSTGAFMLHEGTVRTDSGARALAGMINVGSYVSHVFPRLHLFFKDMLS